LERGGLAIRPASRIRMGRKMSDDMPSDGQAQSQFTDDLLYFFLRVRKERVRKVVRRLRDQYADETEEQLARRLIASKTQLSAMGGPLTHLPMLIPGIGQALQLLGLVGGTSMMTRMHLSLILEIALLYGKDIDDKARVPEMAAVGIGTAAPFLVRVLELNPLYALPAAAISAAAVTQIVGESAIKLYKGEEQGIPQQPMTFTEATI
jgi:hypothetical protein